MIFDRQFGNVSVWHLFLEAKFSRLEARIVAMHFAGALKRAHSSIQLGSGSSGSWCQSKTCTEQQGPEVRQVCVSECVWAQCFIKRWADGKATKLMLRQDSGYHTSIPTHRKRLPSRSQEAAICEANETSSTASSSSEHSPSSGGWFSGSDSESQLQIVSGGWVSPWFWSCYHWKPKMNQPARRCYQLSNIYHITATLPVSRP